MTDNPDPENDLGAELRNLGENLKGVLRAAWESEERKRAQAEIEHGLSDLDRSLREAVDDFSQGSTGQQIKADVEDLRQRLQDSETQARLREDLVMALSEVNNELQKLLARWSTSGAGEASSEEPNSAEPTSTEETEDG